MNRFILGFILVVVGTAIGLAIAHYYPSFPFEDKINAVDLINLLMTIFIAVYIPSFLEKQMHSQRFEKEVIIRKIEGLQATLRDVNRTVTECFQKNTVSLANTYAIINGFNSISNELDILITLIELCYKKKLNTELNSIKKLRHKYKRTVTGGNFGGKGFKYTELTKKEEDVIYHKLDKELCILILKINRM
jgi:hypothetical protein